ncbi:MAG: hypothetical protein ABFQ65_01980 [Nanoarchaeota archaeon]
MKNNKGDIPITILVIGVFAVCTLAVLSFISSTINLRNSFVGVDIIKNVNNQIEFKEFMNEDANYFYQEINKTNIFPQWLKEDELLFSIKYKKP